MIQYDYIFAGGGLAAQMTLLQMATDSYFADKKILILDPLEKTANDRTWCFWEKGAGKFDAILKKKWDQATFKDSQGIVPMTIFPYQYKMIRSADFYQHVAEKCKSLSIDRRSEAVQSIREQRQEVIVETEANRYTGSTVFSSIYDPARASNHANYPLLQQHFIGWFVKTDTPVFDPAKATFMDFSVPQKGNTRFMYVLPTSTNEALVEYTLFSHDLLAPAEYEAAITDYLKNLGATFQIVETERGSIPMTCYPFWEHNSRRLIHIGSAGGWTKASTGFTFRNTLKKSEDLVQSLRRKSEYKPVKNRFWFYDLLLLDILDRSNEKGSSIFSAMFRNGPASTIFKFLDEETTFNEDLQVIWSCPKMLFIRALIRRFLRF